MKIIFCEVKLKKVKTNSFETLEWSNFDVNDKEVKDRIGKEDKELDNGFRKMKNKKLTCKDIVGLMKINDKAKKDSITWSIKSDKTIEEIKSIMRTRIKQVDEIIDNMVLIVNDQNL